MPVREARNVRTGGTSQIVLGDILLGKYHVESQLGQGGMGKVFAARHLELGELFAIKFLATDVRNESKAEQRFLREARSSARLKGEHAVKVHDVGRLESGIPYMIMEYLVGQDLKAYLRQQGKLAIEEAVSFVLQACDALSEAHSLGIIHRDIKPSNLFLTQRRSGTSWIKVLDFGIAKEISVENADMTKSGAAVGSPLYMSPEQMADPKSLDTRTDIWSMGVVLYELLTGSVPFYAETTTELVAKVLQTIPKPPSHICPELPQWIDEIVMHCLEKYPENRFLTMDDLALALRTGANANSEAAQGMIAVGDTNDDGMLDSAPTTLPERISASDIEKMRGTSWRADPQTLVAVGAEPAPLQSSIWSNSHSVSRDELPEATVGGVAHASEPTKNRSFLLMISLVSALITAALLFVATNDRKTQIPTAHAPTDLTMATATPQATEKIVELPPTVALVSAAPPPPSAAAAKPVASKSITTPTSTPTPTIVRVPPSKIAPANPATTASPGHIQLGKEVETRR